MSGDSGAILFYAIQVGLRHAYLLQEKFNFIQKSIFKTHAIHIVMKQMSLFKELNYKEFGGDLLKNKRRSRRPLNCQLPLHIVFKSQYVVAMGGFRTHENLIKRLLFKYANKFSIKIYDTAICSNHIHLLVKARHKIELQNFLRCFLGQVAFALKNPDLISEDTSFWMGRPYTKILSWGQQLDRVLNYIERNRLESVGWIEYKRSYFSLNMPNN